MLAYVIAHLSVARSLSLVLLKKVLEGDHPCTQRSIWHTSWTTHDNVIGISLLASQRFPVQELTSGTPWLEPFVELSDTGSFPNISDFSGPPDFRTVIVRLMNWHKLDLHGFVWICDVCISWNHLEWDILDKSTILNWLMPRMPLQSDEIGGCHMPNAGDSYDSRSDSAGSKGSEQREPQAPCPSVSPLSSHQNRSGMD